MKTKEIYIADRFFVKKNPGYETILNSLNFNEIVTVDSELCRRRHSKLDFEDAFEYSLVNSEFFAFPLNYNEQYIYIEEITNDFQLKTDIDFVYCGLDMIDKYSSNSWITNYGISYDLDKDAYTQYGLLDDLSWVEKWLTKRMKEKGYEELQLSEFTLIAVWRKT